jgi:hypothetical protein
MLLIHCDMEGCKVSAEVSPAPPMLGGLVVSGGGGGGGGVDIPDDWMSVVWETRAESKLTPSETAAEGLVKQFSKMMPEGVKFPDLMDLLPQPIDKVRYQAFICPTHASDLPLREFHKIGTRRLMPNE